MAPCDAGGANTQGQLGDGTSLNTAAPVTVTGFSEPAGIAAGGFHTCVWLVDGDVRCWGYGGDGELGDGTTESHSTPVVTAEGRRQLVQVTAGRNHTCARLTDGSVRCWGSNLRDQVAAGGGDAFLTPVRGAASATLDLVAGLNHTCALLQGRHVSCWGANEAGQLGSGRRRSPVRSSWQAAVNIRAHASPTVRSGAGAATTRESWASTVVP